jgi:hypothetical protein
MALETATYIDDLVATNPTAGDPVSQGDDHIRLLKSVIQATFPNISAAVTPTHTELNYVDGVTSAIQTQIDAKAATSQFASSLGNSGYQTFPGGMILQWFRTSSGVITAGSGTAAVASWPIAFPTAVLAAVSSTDATGWSANTAGSGVYSLTTTNVGVLATNFGGANQTGFCYVFGIGN